MEVKVLSNLKHDGVLYEAGKTIDLDKDIAYGLIKAGVVERSKKVSEPEKPEEPKKEKSLSKMNKAELTAEAAEKGIDVTEEMTKDEMIAKIKGE